MNYTQSTFLDSRQNNIQIHNDKPRFYGSILTVTANMKGVIDVDTVKGCMLGMSAYPKRGCYSECYANKIAIRRGYDFTKSISRRFLDREHIATVIRLLNSYPAIWYRVGVAGDPCHDWDNTVVVCRALRHTYKVPIIITKHWNTIEDAQIQELLKLNATFNTSISPLDTDDEIKHRLEQRERLSYFGINSVLRVVTCNFGVTEWAKERKEKQDYLLSLKPIIDNTLRVSKTNKHILKRDLLFTRRNGAVGGGHLVSLHNHSIYLGECKLCPDQCGIKEGENEVKVKQIQMFTDKIEFIHVPSVIGSGFEQDVATLALEDGIAHRAARKNMQIHSAVILKINNEFAGFMTFQNNDECKEFCLLQSVIKPEKYTDELYLQMVQKVIDQNTKKYPAIMTTNPKSKFETPKLYESLGFVTYLAMSGFCYMVHGELSDVRMKLLAHITMTNLWNSTKGEWLKLKDVWNTRIEKAGEECSIPNPKFATREGCWQGEHGFANVVTGHSHNGNASVLDPVACEVILRMFTPKNVKRIYNPFGGGVQFGFVAGACGYEYVASEIRQNQCDANNKLCGEFKNVNWIKSDSSTYEPEGMFDLIFTCPPYYRVEKYIDYDGNPPEGEINTLPNYETFRDTLFSGYKIAISHLNDNCFFVVMTGDSRDKNGAYYCSEAETELFFKKNSLSVYNKIVYLEGEFTRLAQAKKTLNYRKFPKSEQKIIVAYKGDIQKIKEYYQPIGRL